jgi:hypothetical protein
MLNYIKLTSASELEDEVAAIATVQVVPLIAVTPVIHLNAVLSASPVVRLSSVPVAVGHSVGRSFVLPHEVFRRSWTDNFSLGSKPE